MIVAGDAAGSFHAAMLEALRNAESFSGAINGVFEGPALKATAPFAEIGELMVSDWGTKDRAGSELRSAIIIIDRAEGPGRLHRLAAAADAAMATVPRDLPGWRIASLVLLRSRIVRDGPGAWTALVEHRVRIIEAD